MNIRLHSSSLVVGANFVSKDSNENEALQAHMHAE